MNKGRIKAYAPTARNELIEAVAAKAQILGLSDKKIEPVEVKGDLAIIAGRPFPRQIAPLRRNLEQAVRREGFDQLVERIAFTWFNRFTALRYMELHGFLDHGYRVLSHPKGGNIPEILEHATDLDLTGLDKSKVSELRLAGSKDNELYRLLLLAQCNALNTALPFLFERTNDETELLLPDNLLHTDSPLRRLVSEIDEADWSDVEIVGWLYQFYISEKKDAVIGKVVKSQDIPAATQLFTPNWIVKYLTQNTLGRQWLATYPASAIKGKMEFYIEPAEQTGEVKSQLKAITPAELNPEEITFFDPACGSGHILVEAYDLFKQIYEERGYARRDIPRFILEKNLFGLDIDERAAQLSAFALMMKARADDRNLFRAEPPIKLNVMAIKESNGLDIEQIAETLTREKIEVIDDHLKPEQQTLAGFETKPIQKSLVAASKSEIDKETLMAFLEFFKDAKTYGSLLRISERFAALLPTLQKLIDPAKGRDLDGHTAAEELRPFIVQAKVLTTQFDNVASNPPYMGNKGMNDLLRAFREKHFKISKYDLFSMFLERSMSLTADSGLYSMIIPQSWMFINTFSAFREYLYEKANIRSLCHFKGEALGVGFDVSIVVISPHFVPQLKTIFLRGIENFEQGFVHFKRYIKNVFDMEAIPNMPLSYWASKEILHAFEDGCFLEQIAKPKAGMLTTNNDLFVRLWYEVSLSSICFNAENSIDGIGSHKKWFPYNKGGGHRKWYGNNLFVVNFYNNGQEICDYIDNQPNVKVKSNGRVTNRDYYFRKCITWSDIGFTNFAARAQDKGFIFDITGMSIFPSSSDFAQLLAFLCSNTMFYLMKILNPTFHFQAGDMARVPFKRLSNLDLKVVEEIACKAIEIAKQDWNFFEYSWGFECFPLCRNELRNKQLSETWKSFQNKKIAFINSVKSLEELNNKTFIELYQLGTELESSIDLNEITLSTNEFFRYPNEADRFIRESRFKSDMIKEFVSFIIGCVMGRYSLDKPGLIYANAGNEGFDPTQYITFPADDDGIVPVCDIDWFTDDATPRLVEFIKTVFGIETLDENLAWIAESFEPKKGENPVETIRRYFSTQFFKNHMQMYKKRPIYWLFSSGKQKAFECLVYLHRYNESTLARMRAQYVTPLQGKLNARIEHLRRETDSAGSTAAKTKLRKEVEILVKKQTELAKFDEELRHYADQRIKLDLDDGVRVNYGKFGTLLAEVKAITGGNEE